MDKGFLTKSAFHLAKNIITTKVEQLLKKKKILKKKTRWIYSHFH